MNIRTLVPAVLACALAACGGGGGGGGNAAVTPAPTEQPATVASLDIGAGMTWQTADDYTLTVTVTTPGGTAATDAAVRVFTATSASPQGGQPLADDQGQPVYVAQSQLVSDITDAQGKVELKLRLPLRDAATPLLVVSTSGDMRAQAMVNATGNQVSTTLKLVAPES